jgi:hypothetical protein
MISLRWFHTVYTSGLTRSSCPDSCRDPRGSFGTPDVILTGEVTSAGHQGRDRCMWLLHGL